MVWNPESTIWYGIRNPLWYGFRNPESWNPESRGRDPESRTFMDSLTWGETIAHFASRTTVAQSINQSINQKHLFIHDYLKYSVADVVVRSRLTFVSKRLKCSTDFFFLPFSRAAIWTLPPFRHLGR